jgi:hypothetical protein
MFASLIAFLHASMKGNTILDLCNGSWIWGENGLSFSTSAVTSLQRKSGIVWLLLLQRSRRDMFWSALNALKRLGELYWGTTIPLSAWHYDVDHLTSTLPWVSSLRSSFQINQIRVWNLRRVCVCGVWFPFLVFSRLTGRPLIFNRIGE